MLYSRVELRAVRTPATASSSVCAPRESFKDSDWTGCSVPTPEVELNPAEPKTAIINRSPTAQYDEVVNVRESAHVPTPKNTVSSPTQLDRFATGPPARHGSGPPTFGEGFVVLWVVLRVFYRGRVVFPSRCPLRGPLIPNLLTEY